MGWAVRWAFELWAGSYQTLNDAAWFISSIIVVSGRILYPPPASASLPLACQAVFLLGKYTTQQLGNREFRGIVPLRSWELTILFRQRTETRQRKDGLVLPK